MQDKISKLLFLKQRTAVIAAIILSLNIAVIISTAPSAHADDVHDAIAKLLTEAKSEQSRRKFISAAKSYDFIAKRYGSDHPIMARFLNQLAKEFVRRTRYRDAQPLLERALLIEEKYFGPEHREVAATLHNLSEVYRLQGKYVQAEPFLKRDLSINVEHYGSVSKDVAQSLSTLARLYKQMGRFEESERLYMKSIQLREKLLGPRHGDVAKVRTDAAQMYLQWKNFPKAEKQYKRALQIYEGALGPKHLYSLIAKNNLAAYYQNTGQDKKALTIYKRNLKIFRDHIGKDSPYAATPHANLAEIYRKQGRYDAAEKHLRRSLEIIEKTYGQNHAESGIIYSDLGGLYLSKGKHETAIELYLQAIKIFSNLFGDKHASTANLYFSLANAYKAQGDQLSALKFYDKSETIYKNSFGPYHKSVSKCLQNKLEILNLLNRHDDVKRIKKTLKLMPKPGTRHVSFYYATNRKGDGKAGFTGKPNNKIKFGQIVLNVSEESVKQRADRIAKSLGRLEKSSSGALTEADTAKIILTHNVPDVQKLADLIRKKRPRPAIFKKQLLIFVHGYNNSFDGAMKRAAQLSFDLQFDGVLIPFTWPSRGSLTGYLNDVSYADKSIGSFISFLDQISDNIPDVKIHVIAHSLGNKVVLKALCKIAKRKKEKRRKFGQIISAHADTSQKEFDRLTTCFKKHVEGITLYINENDAALGLRCGGLSRCRAGNFARGYASADAIDTTKMSKGFLQSVSKGLNHDVFVRNPLLFGDIARLLLTGRRPVSIRTREFRKQKDPHGHSYWAYDKKYNPAASFNPIRKK